MNYDESIAWLESLGQFGIRLGMERIQQLLFVLGHPENQVKTIHVAGTNGKGSTLAFLYSVSSCFFAVACCRMPETGT